MEDVKTGFISLLVVNWNAAVGTDAGGDARTWSWWPQSWQQKSMFMTVLLNADTETPQQLADLQNLYLYKGAPFSAKVCLSVCTD